MTRGIYLIKNNDNNLIKIGKANNVEKRFKQIQPSFRFCGQKPNLTILKIIETEYKDQMERYLHNKFSEYKVLNEWFNVDVDDIAHEISKFKPTKEIHRSDFVRDINADNTEIIEEFLISTKYLKDKNFSYSLYIRLLLQACDEGEYYCIRGTNMTKLVNTTNISRNTIIDKINRYNEFEKIPCKFRPGVKIKKSTSNIVKIDCKDIKKIAYLDEMVIRHYILFKILGDKISEYTQRDILYNIGYNSKSNRNCAKLKESKNIIEQLY